MAFLAGPMTAVRTYATCGDVIHSRKRCVYRETSLLRQETSECFRGSNDVKEHVLASSTIRNVRVARLCVMEASGSNRNGGQQSKRGGGALVPFGFMPPPPWMARFEKDAEANLVLKLVEESSRQMREKLEDAIAPWISSPPIRETVDPEQLAYSDSRFMQVTDEVKLHYTQARKSKVEVRSLSRACSLLGFGVNLGRTSDFRVQGVLQAKQQLENRVESTFNEAILRHLTRADTIQG
eukprot:3399618-Pyramimonas_sp.AAC.2